MTELICTTCPRGCHLQVDENNGFKVTGNACKRGEVYGYNEVTNPKRVITSTVRTASAEYPRCPVKTSEAVPKAKMFEIMKLLDDIKLDVPIKCGDIVIKNVLDTGADFITCKDID